MKSVAYNEFKLIGDLVSLISSMLDDDIVPSHYRDALNKVLQKYRLSCTREELLRKNKHVNSR